MKIPNDADGDAMRRVLSDGSDPERPMDIDFMIACPNLTTAEQIAPHVSSRGYIIKIGVDEESSEVTCYCAKRMLLNYDDLIATQNELDAIAHPYGGYIDGWGTFGNTQETGLDG